ncbi:hypothetical protein [Streptomyces sp. IBSBF 2950]|uniref:hypothetical protein n=1 Tax=Streptomyces sp. IBSBF 2950 TaxID=2903528 RepID=UPI002FDBDB8D
MQNTPSYEARSPATVIAPQSPRLRIVYPRPAIPVQIFQEPAYLVEVSASQRAAAAGILSADEHEEAVDPAPK